MCQPQGKKIIMNVIYDRSDEEWTSCLHDKEKQRLAASWMQSGTLDRWRHHRMLAPIQPFISTTTSWLTVGDGRYGTDAHFIISNGGAAHATDLSDKLLSIGSQSGFIKSFSAENAEQLSFEDNSFDYVLIKEAFHHCPRPWLALYEAFRVCRKAVILIEPSDDNSYISKNPLAAMRQLASSLFKLGMRISGQGVASKSYYGFEPVGNFVYCINPVELEKFLLGMHYNFIGTIGLNDVYEGGVEFVRFDNPANEDIKIIRRLHRKIKLKNLSCRLGLLGHNILIASLFKEKPGEDLSQRLKTAGWEIKELPRNPFL
jgi:ubiquinone/menaquinone biosynthesis C-methylase UbiE